MAKKNNMSTTCLVAASIVLFGIFIYFIYRCKYTEKFIASKQATKAPMKLPMKLPIKVSPKQQVSTDTYNKITSLIQLSNTKGMNTVFPQSNMFNDELTNNKTILVQKVFEMLNGRIDKLTKLSEKYPNVKPGDKVKPQEMQVEIDKIRKIINKIPIFKKHDYTKLFTRGVDPKSKEYTSLYYLGMKANDQSYKTNLCSKNKECMKVNERLSKVFKSREEIIKNVSMKYNKENIKEKFDWGLSDTPDEGTDKKCEWNGLFSYGNFCGPTRSVSAAEQKTGGPCDPLDSCCYDHDVGYGDCQREGDWCLNSDASFLVGAGLCTSSFCVAGVDLQLCQCATSVLGSTLGTLGLWDSGSIDSWSGLPYTAIQLVLFCTYRHIISLIVGIIALLIYVVVFIFELIVDIVLWIGDLLVDLAEWFGDAWNDFWNWCLSWLPTQPNPDYKPSPNTPTVETQSSMLKAIVSESGSAVDQVTRITDQIANIFDTSPTRRTGMGCPTRRDCGSCCIERQGNETELQHKSRLLCCLRSPDETDYRKLKPNIKPLPKPNLPLAPPSGGGGGMIPGVSPIVATYCNKNNEVIIQEDGTRSVVRGDNRCCVSECIENTWHKKCGTNQDDFRSIPGDVWSSDYLSQDNLGVPCSQSQPCFMRNGTMYDCNNPPSGGGSGGGGGGGGGSGDGSQYGTVRPNVPRF